MYRLNDCDTQVASDDDGDLRATTPATDIATAAATDSTAAPATRGGGPATSGATTPATSGATTPPLPREGMAEYDIYRRRYRLRKKGDTMDPWLSRLDDYDKLYLTVRDETRQLAYNSRKLWDHSRLKGKQLESFLQCFNDIAREAWSDRYKNFTRRPDSWYATTLSSLPRGESPQPEACPEMNDCNCPDRESPDFVLC